METIEISLEGLRFHSRHGVFPQERKVGGEYEVDIRVTLAGCDGMRDDISDTVSYVDLYEIARDEMSQPRDLIETVARNINSRIVKEFKVLESEVSVAKLSPPISGIIGSAKVTVRYSRS